jgi:malonyl-CoA O-methyltransferase
MNQLPDKHLVGSRFGRTLHSYRLHASVQRRMASRLVELAGRSGLPGHVGRVLEVGAGSALLTEALLENRSVGSYFANDLVAGSREFVARALGERPVGEWRFLQGDIERLTPLPGNLSLVVSNATVQWLHDLEAFFGRMAALLEPGGMLAFSTFGPGNMREIALLEGVSLAYRTAGEVARLADAGFEMLAVEEEERRLEFASPEAVLRHIRETGVNGVAGHSWTRTRYRQFLDRYREAFPCGGGVGLTYHPVYCCFRRREG